MVMGRPLRYCLVIGLLIICGGMTIVKVVAVNVTDPVVQHVVQPGETLRDLSEMYGRSTDVIADQNQLYQGQSLVVGQRIMIPTHLGTDASSPLPATKRSNTHRYQVAKTMPASTMPSSFVPSKPASVRDTVLKQDQYAYFGNGESVADALRGFASNYSLPIKISEKVKSIVNGTIGPLKPVAFLDKISRLNNLIWYFDNSTLYVYDAEEIKKTIINLGYLSTDHLRKILVDMNLWDGRYEWNARPMDGLIYLSGPPRYVDLVEQTAAIIDAKEENREKNTLTFKAFKLKYAWAESRTVHYRNQQVSVPGVADLLKQIVLGSGGRNISVAEANTPTRSHGLQPVKTITGKSLGQSKTPASESGASKSASHASANGAYISADRLSNSVIINDLESRMPMYAKLIATLDQPLSQIEINVSIIDVDTSSIDELGVDWQLGSNKTFGVVNPIGALGSTSPSTILKVTAGKLLAQVRFLATQNKAKILSRPSVLTLDNMEAILDNNQTFYVPVAGSSNGDNTAQLYPITSGSILRVTPRVIDDDKKKRIHLDVNVEDGTSQNSTLSGVSLPIVKNTTISTQAVINEGESLLIGGYFYEKKSTVSNKVPILGDLPILGRFFRSDSKQYAKNVRLFLITPRITNF